jgi:hypothetical protein
MGMNHRRAGFATLAMLLVLGLAVLAAAGCGDEGTTTTAAPTTQTTGAPTDTTAGGATGASGTIAVKGMVDNPMTLTVEVLQGMNPETLTIEHPKKGPTEYTGVRFSAILEALKVQAAAKTVVLTASDGFAAEVPLADIATSTDGLLAIGDDGALSSAFPGLEGQFWVKDIVSMEFK